MRFPSFLLPRPSPLHHQILADGELDDGHRVDGAEGHVHRLVVGIVADEADAAGLFGTVDVLHGQVFVAAAVEGDEVHLAVDDFVERGERLEADDVARLQDGVHRVAADVDGAVAAGDVGYLYLAQYVLGAVGQQGLQVGGGGDVVQGDAAFVQRVGRLGRVQQLYFAAGHGAVAVVGAVAGDALAGQ